MLHRSFDFLIRQPCTPGNREIEVRTLLADITSKVHGSGPEG